MRTGTPAALGCSASVGGASVPLSCAEFRAVREMVRETSEGPDYPRDPQVANLNLDGRSPEACPGIVRGLSGARDQLETDFGAKWLADTQRPRLAPTLQIGRNALLQPVERMLVIDAVRQAHVESRLRSVLQRNSISYGAALNGRGQTHPIGGEREHKSHRRAEVARQGEAG